MPLAYLCYRDVLLSGKEAHMIIIIDTMGHHVIMDIIKIFPVKIQVSSVKIFNTAPASGLVHFFMPALYHNILLFIFKTVDRINNSVQVAISRVSIPVKTNTHHWIATRQE